MMSPDELSMFVQLVDADQAGHDFQTLVDGVRNLSDKQIKLVRDSSVEDVVDAMRIAKSTKDEA